MLELAKLKSQTLPGLINHTGVDNCGKTTQVRNLVAKLRDKGVDVATSKAYGPQEKEVWGYMVDGLLASQNPIGDFMITSLFHLLRRKQASQALKDLKAGKIVVADRWDESFLIYHRQNEPLSKYPRMLEWMWGNAFFGLVPEMTIFYDVDPQTARNRSGGSVKNNDGFDNASLEYHQGMYDGFHDLAKVRGWSMIDATKSIQEVEAQVWDIIAPVYVQNEIVQANTVISLD